MYLPDGAAFSLAILVGALAAANVGLLGAVNVRNASVIRVFPDWLTRLAGQGVVSHLPAIPAVLRSTLRGWVLGIVALLFLVLTLHMGNILVDGLRAEAPNGANKPPELSAPPVTQGQVGSSVSDVAGASVSRQITLETTPARLITAIVVSVFMLAIGLTLAVVIKAAGELPPKVGEGPTPNAGRTPPFLPLNT